MAAALIRKLDATKRFQDIFWRKSRLTFIEVASAMQSKISLIQIFEPKSIQFQPTFHKKNSRDLRRLMPIDFRVGKWLKIVFSQPIFEFRSGRWEFYMFWFWGQPSVDMSIQVPNYYPPFQEPFTKNAENYFNLLGVFVEMRIKIEFARIQFPTPFWISIWFWLYYNWMPGNKNRSWKCNTERNT